MSHERKIQIMIDTDALIMTACQRVLNDEEVAQMNNWAYQFKDDPASPGYPLHDFCVKFIRETRPTPFFGANFMLFKEDVLTLITQAAQRDRGKGGGW